MIYDSISLNALAKTLPSRAALLCIVVIVEGYQTISSNPDQDFVTCFNLMPTQTRMNIVQCQIDAQRFSMKTDKCVKSKYLAPEAHIVAKWRLKTLAAQEAADYHLS